VLRPTQSRWFQAVFCICARPLRFLRSGCTGRRDLRRSRPLQQRRWRRRMGRSRRPRRAVATIHARTNLVVVDVVVTDSKKNPVHGLQKSDFTLMEDGKLQVVRSFEEHSSSPAAEQIESAPEAACRPVHQQVGSPANGPVNVLLLDYLNTPVASQPYARRQLLEFLDKAPAGTRMPSSA